MPGPGAAADKPASAAWVGGVLGFSLKGLQDEESHRLQAQMRASAPLPLVLAAFLLSLLPPAMRASEVCSSTKSTVEETGCVIAALKAMDQRLEQALEAVALEARAVPSEVFQTLWRDNLTGFYKTSADPVDQAAAFRNERRKVCAYAKSVAFQGTGYGIFTTRCELALTQTLLDQLKP